MKRLDDDKVSLVDFLRSIKYGRRSHASGQGYSAAHFAGFSPQARADQKANPEDQNLVRSYN